MPETEAPRNRRGKDQLEGEQLVEAGDRLGLVDGCRRRRELGLEGVPGDGGAVEHLHDEELGDLRERIEAGSGFTLGSTEITLFGLCKNCRAA